jgi:two-component system sensor histidine kinase BaeS
LREVNDDTLESLNSEARHLSKIVNDLHELSLADAGRLKQLFSNLLENTLRYADAPGTLTIGQEMVDNRLLFYFEDSGPGVPEESLERLFDRLYRVDRSRSRTKGGSGLGLSICKSIISALGGEIRAINGKSGGLRIEIELPLA